MINYDAILRTPIGCLGVFVDHNRLARLTFLPSVRGGQMSQNPLLQSIKVQLEHYFDDARFHFTLPVLLAGTALQRKIWRSLQLIPLGETVNYGTLAKEIGTSARVIGNACRANPLPIIFPCHRVVAQNGVGGFAGQRSGCLIDAKTWLLRHEQAKGQ